MGAGRISRHRCADRRLDRLVRVAARVALASLLLLTAACTSDERNPRSKEPAPSASASPQTRTDGFTRVVAPFGLPDRSPSWGAAGVDWNLDSWPDLLVGRHKRHAALLISRDGDLEETAAGNLTEPAPGRKIYDLHPCAWGESNADGVPDLYCTSGAQSGEGEGPNRLLVQGPSGHLRDVAPEVGVDDPTGRGRSVNWLDFDQDGDLDLFVGNEVREGVPNVLFENQDARFLPTSSPVATSLAVRSSSWGDLNNDGYPDLFVLGHGALGSRAYLGGENGFTETEIDEVTGRPWLSAAFEDTNDDGWVDVALVSETETLILRNRSGELELQSRITSTDGRMAVWLDADNDGDVDMFLVRGAPGEPPAPDAKDRADQLWTQGPGGKFSRSLSIESEHGNGEAATAADYDRDGDIDLFISNGYRNTFGSFEMLWNETRGKWLGIELLGPPENPLGIGSRVSVELGATVLHRAVTDEVSFQTQSDVRILHFGLGETQEESAIARVRWPGGAVTCTPIETDRYSAIDIKTAEAC